MQAISLFAFLIITFSCMFGVLSQTTDDCGVNKGCFLSPGGCSGSGCNFIYKWTNNFDGMNFELYGNLNGVVNKWLAIGFSKDQEMGDDSVVVCKTNSAVETNYNSPYFYSSLLLPSNPSIGLSNQNVKLIGNWMSCSFTRLNKVNASNYFDLTQNYYILAAYGNFDANTGQIQKHDVEKESSSIINFQPNVVVNQSVDYHSYMSFGTMVLSLLFIRLFA